MEKKRSFPLFSRYWSSEFWLITWVGDRFLELSIKFSFYFPNKFFEEKLVFTFFSSFFTLKLDAPIMAKKNFQKCALDVNLVSISASAYSISEKKDRTLSPTCRLFPCATSGSTTTTCIGPNSPPLPRRNFATPTRIWTG